MSVEGIWDEYELELYVRISTYRINKIEILTIHRIVDPQYKEELKDVEVDLVTWKTYILHALKQLHGVFGSAIDVNIIRNEGKKSIVQIQMEDTKTFTSAITSFITDLSIFGYQHVNGHISYRKVDA